MYRRVNQMSFISAAWVMLLGVGCGGTDTTRPPTTVFPADPYAVVPSDQGKLSIEVRTGPSQPPGRGEADVQLIVHDGAGALVGGLEVEATPLMPAHAHGAPGLSVATSNDGTGTYVLRNVSMYMPGIWELRTRFSGAVMDTATPVFDVP